MKDDSDFYGHATRVLENEHIRLEYLAETGPRIVRVFMHGNGENQLAELPDVTLPSPNGEYAIYGGHRLWMSPEFPETTYYPENGGLHVEQRNGAVQLTAGANATGIVKRMWITLDPDRAAVDIEHELANAGSATVVLAPWAITQVPLGGTAVLPRRAWWLDPAGLQPTKNIVLWDYAALDDPRLEITREQITVRADGTGGPFKIGHLNHVGWIGYVRNGVLFLKSFTPQTELPHPDFGCNAEVYTNNRFLELESLGVLGQLAPGQAVSHRERWEFYAANAALPGSPPL